MKIPLCYVLVQKFQWIIYRNTNYSLYKQCSCAATIIIFVPSLAFLPGTLHIKESLQLSNIVCVWPTVQRSF